jgi:hypothetical protein
MCGWLKSVSKVIGAQGVNNTWIQNFRSKAAENGATYIYLYLASRSRHITPRKRASSTHYIGGCVGLRAILEVVVRRLGLTLLNIKFMYVLLQFKRTSPHSFVKVHCTKQFQLFCTTVCSLMMGQWGLKIQELVCCNILTYSMEQSPSWEANQ